MGRLWRRQRPLRRMVAGAGAGAGDQRTESPEAFDLRQLNDDDLQARLDFMLGPAPTPDLTYQGPSYALVKCNAPSRSEIITHLCAWCMSHACCICLIRHTAHHASVQHVPGHMSITPLQSTLCTQDRGSSERVQPEALGYDRGRTKWLSSGSAAQQGRRKSRGVLSRRPHYKLDR